MPDDRGRVAQDRTRINVNHVHEVLFWTKQLGVSETKLKEIVAQVGNLAENVRRAARVKHADPSK